MPILVFIASHWKGAMTQGKRVSGNEESPDSVDEFMNYIESLLTFFSFTVASMSSCP